MREFQAAYREENWRYPPGGTTRGGVAEALPLLMESNAVDSADPTNMATFTILHYNVTSEQLMYAGVILTVDLVLVITNLLMIVIITTSETLQDVINFYLVSLSVADLVLGVFVCPLSVYASLDPKWQFMGDRSPLCKSVSYAGVAIISKKIYMYVWIAVDRYAMINKPTRYEAEQTLTRCKCWILFSWSTAILLSCPTMFTDMTSYFDYAKICLIAFRVMPAYSTTLGTLVFLPSTCCILYSYFYIFRKFISLERQPQEVRVVLENDNTILTIFVTMIMFLVSWLPWLVLRAYDSLSRYGGVTSDVLNFALLWLGISGGCWKLIIFLCLNPDFRAGALALCGCPCRSREHSEYNMINGVNRERERFL